MGFVPVFDNTMNVLFLKATKIFFFDWGEWSLICDPDRYTRLSCLPCFVSLFYSEAIWVKNKLD
jgi:hypothetical protein